MKINELNINGYGKIQDKQMKFKDGINVVYGKNEEGKSTLLNFIQSSLYGISKKKNGKEISDFDKYKPWVGENFSGQLKYELDNGAKYEVHREFKKTAPTIYNDKMEDISKEFNISKAKGNEFFYDQTQIDEELFKSTFMVSQQEVKLNSNNQTMLIQKISNLVGTGEDNVSYKIAMQRINKRQLDEVGTSRSKERPINVTTSRIEKLEEEKSNFENYQDEKDDIDNKLSQIVGEKELLEDKYEVLKEIQNIRENQITEKERLKVQRSMNNENIEKVNNLKMKKLDLENEEKNVYEESNAKKNNKGFKIALIIGLILLIAINVAQVIFIKDYLINAIIGGVTLLIYVILLIISKVSSNKNRKEIEAKTEELKKEQQKIENEIKILNENIEIMKNEIFLIDQKMNINKTDSINKMKAKYGDIINEDEIVNALNVENLYELSDRLREKINRLEVTIHTLNIDKEEIEKKLQSQAELEEVLTIEKEKLEKLQAKEKSLELAKKILEEAYDEMKNNVTPKFTDQLSNKIAKITNSKYKKAMYNDEKGLIVETEDGSYVSANMLSIGTIDQLYLSLRLSMIDDLTEETLPIILDESFVYYDDDRLQNILTYLAKDLKNRQVIVFTCNDREKQALEKAKIKYNYIEM